MDHASFWLKTGTPHLPKWYMLLTEVVYTAYRNGTLSLPKTGTLLGTDYKNQFTSDLRRSSSWIDDELSVAEVLKKLGDRLIQLRTEASMSQRELGISSGIDNSKIAKIELGKVNITLVTFYGICDGLGTTPQHFMDI